MTEKDSPELEKCDFCGEYKDCRDFRQAETVLSVWRFELQFISSSDTLCLECATDQ